MAQSTAKTDEKKRKRKLDRAAEKRQSRCNQPEREETRRENLSLSQLCEMSDEQLARLDIGLVDLLCAMGLPGGPDGDIERYLDWLDEAAERVRLQIDRNYYKFIEDPALYNISQAYFCIVCMVTVLQRELGVRYNPKWQGITPDKPAPKDFGKDAADAFIHTIIDGVGGTCGSLPMLYVAVGRRLGYPLKLVKAVRHLYFRWDDPSGAEWVHGDRFNIEATGPGIHALSDEHYRTWPHPVPSTEAEIYGKSLTPLEELAECLATRGYVCSANNYLPGAIEAFRYASKLAPHNPFFPMRLEYLIARRKMLRRGHMYINAPSPSPNHLTNAPQGPFGVGHIAQSPTTPAIAGHPMQAPPLQPHEKMALASSVQRAKPPNLSWPMSQPSGMPQLSNQPNLPLGSASQINPHLPRITP